MATDSEIYDEQFAALCGNRLTSEVARFIAVLASDVRKLNEKVAALQAEREGGEGR